MACIHAQQTGQALSAKLSEASQLQNSGAPSVQVQAVEAKGRLAVAAPATSVHTHEVGVKQQLESKVPTVVSAGLLEASRAQAAYARVRNGFKVEGVRNTTSVQGEAEPRQATGGAVLSVVPLATGDSLLESSRGLRALPRVLSALGEKEVMLLQPPPSALHTEHSARINLHTQLVGLCVQPEFGCARASSSANVHPALKQSSIPHALGTALLESSRREDAYARVVSSFDPKEGVTGAHLASKQHGAGPKSCRMPRAASEHLLESRRELAAYPRVLSAMDMAHVGQPHSFVFGSAAMVNVAGADCMPTAWSEALMEGIRANQAFSRVLSGVKHSTEGWHSRSGAQALLLPMHVVYGNHACLRACAMSMCNEHVQ
jgi:hypothetical protein